MVLAVASLGDQITEISNAPEVNLFCWLSFDAYKNLKWPNDFFVGVLHIIFSSWCVVDRILKPWRRGRWVSKGWEGRNPRNLSILLGKMV